MQRRDILKMSLGTVAVADRFVRLGLIPKPATVAGIVWARTPSI